MADPDIKGKTSVQALNVLDSNLKSAKSRLNDHWDHTDNGERTLMPHL